MSRRTEKRNKQNGLCTVGPITMVTYLRSSCNLRRSFMRRCFCERQLQLFSDTFLVRSIMRQRQPTSTSAKETATSDTTHVLLQTNDGLLLGTTDQIEHGGQENLKTVFIATLFVNGRKRTIGVVVCLGKYALGL